MATDVDQSCYGWSREELDDQDDSREISISQMLDHGSISFGRFALEPLSWEKRSVFTHNRHQEELEKFTGLVAQKKAYFEEYYKKLRAMKFLQENQHTVPSSNCGDSSGISVHIREDQRVVPDESDRDEIIKNIGSLGEKASTEVTLDVDGETALVELVSPANLSKDYKNGGSPSPNCGDSSSISVHIREDQRVVPDESDSDEIIQSIGPLVEKASIEVNLEVAGETAIVELESPANLSKDNKNGETPSISKHLKILDINSYRDESITTITVDSKQHDFIRDDDKLEPRGVISESISRQFGIENQRVIGKKSHGDDLEYVIGSDREKTFIEMPLGIDFEAALLVSDLPVKSDDDDKMCEKSLNFKQFQFLDQNSSNYEHIMASIEDPSKQLDFISHGSDEVLKKTEKYVPNDSFYSSCSLKVLEDKVNTEQKKVNQAKGFKGNAFSSAVMRRSSTTGDFVKSELKAKPATVMLTQFLRDSSLKRNGKNNATVASHRSNNEMHSKVTTPRPFSFATGKQAVASISASAGYNAKNIFCSSSLPPKNINSKGVSNRPGIRCSQRIDKLESRSGHEPRRQPLIATRQATHFKGVSANNVIRPLKSRSVNLPPTCNGETNFGTNSNRCMRNNEDRKRTVNDETCLKQVGQHGRSTIFHVMSGNQNPDTIKVRTKADTLLSSTTALEIPAVYRKNKMAPSRIRDLPINLKNSQFGDNSLDRRKTRPEKPRWR